MKNETLWSHSMKTQRKQKDEFFSNHHQSPISEEDQLKFTGLDYYDPNTKYRFELMLNEYSDHKPIQLNDSKGNIRNMLIWGEFNFDIEGENYTLQAYKTDAKENRLFVPFKDLTNGKETYGAGKYLDLYYEEDLTPGEKWILDFNKSTNPWCAYSENYACPLVPPANWLKIEIKAGEKAYPLSLH